MNSESRSEFLFSDFIFIPKASHTLIVEYPEEVQSFPQATLQE